MDEGFVIQIQITRDLRIACQTNCPDRNVVVMALEIAKIDLERKLREQAERKLEMAPPGLIVPRS